MSITRRGFILASASTLLAGCATSGRSLVGSNSGWSPLAGNATSRSGHPPLQQTYSPTSSGSVAGGASGGGGRIVIQPRTSWSKAKLEGANVNPMRQIKHLTIHHEGYREVNFTDAAETVARLQAIQRYHHEELGWADIGYHYIIDRAGRVWEGRPLGYQGAHVKAHNPENVGIMVLGNFELQQPSQQQVTSLVAMVNHVAGKYRLPVREVRTHREWPDQSTRCPGRNLQRQVDAMRRV